ncbi:hypothetical protein VTK73DRAFT_7077 [Phialemonium thermophilum]|uniref:Uncharacterized protein n=1 Tax=Phialemonium thermophilum TaxID=223376 RepID=A0ABR3XTM2_9PEZI
MHAYNTRRQDPSTAAVPAASTVSQAGSPSYAASVSSGAPQWGPSASSQSRRSIPYNSAHTGSVANYHVASAGGSESPNLQPFHVRPQSEHYRGHMSSNSNNSTGGSSDNAYGTQHAQAQGQPTAYVPYQSQSQASPSSGQWYGLGGRSSHPASSGYGTGTQNGASTGYPNGSGQDGYGHYSAQQQSMNLSGHTYSSLDGDSQTIYNLLRGDPGN